MEVTVFVDKRHVKDILRSMSHELVHHTQNCRGEFDGGIKTGPGYAQEDEHMREMERQAYEKGQMILRDFEDKCKKENQQMSRINEAAAKPDYIDIDKDGDKEESMKKAAQDKKAKKGNKKDKKKKGGQPPQLAKAQGKDAASEKEEVDEGKGKLCPKCKKLICEPHCSEGRRRRWKKIGLKAIKINFSSKD